MRKFIFLLVTGISVALMCGCVRKIYVPVDHVKVLTDTVRLSARVSDTLHIHDSIRIELKGDTVRELRWRTRTRILTRTDTVYRHRTDTVRIKEPVPVKTGEVSMGSVKKIYVYAAVILFVCVAFMRIFRKNR